MSGGIDAAKLDALSDRFARQGRPSSAQGPDTFPLADLERWSTIAATPKAFLMAGYVPARELTLATGAGGANKSTFGQQLATCVAAGRPMLGVDVQPGGALYITAEDDEDRLHWMQEHICTAIGVPMVALAGKLHLASLRGRLGNELATFDADGKLRSAPSFALLKATVAHTCVSLVVLDNAAHMFAGNENDRGQVTAFVNLLYSLCADLGVTVILVAHSNKAGDSYSGSTAWLNAVRSQIVLSRPEDSHDPDERVLTLGKANYARADAKIRFRWHDFALVRDDDLPEDQRVSLAASAEAAHANNLFLRCLDKATEERRAVSHARAAANYAPRVFAKMTIARGARIEVFEQALEGLMHLGEIIAEQRIYQRDNRTWATGIARAQSPAQSAHKTVAQSCTEPTHKAALNGAPYTTYMEGAPLEGGAPSRERTMILAPGETGSEPIPGLESEA